MTISFSVKLSTDKITPDLKRKQKQLATVPKLAFVEWQQHTPIRSGNARRRTYLKKEVIVTQYPYAQRLDEGYSNQAPDGMSKPVAAFLQRLVDRIMRKR
jgi:hypothetical protein